MKRIHSLKESNHNNNGGNKQDIHTNIHTMTNSSSYNMMMIQKYKIIIITTTIILIMIICTIIVPSPNAVILSTSSSDGMMILPKNKNSNSSNINKTDTKINSNASKPKVHNEENDKISNDGIGVNNNTSKREDTNNDNNGGTFDGEQQQQSSLLYLSSIWDDIAEPPCPSRSTSKCVIDFKPSATRMKRHMAICNFIPYGKNFGDELGPAMSQQLLEHYFCGNSSTTTIHNYTILNLASQNARTKRSKEKYTCLFTLGSILHFVNQRDHIWGTGANPYRLVLQTKGATKAVIQSKNIVVHSTRGPHTWKLFQDIEPNKTMYGSSGPNSSIGQQQNYYGDPGFLTPYLYPQYQKNSTTEATTQTKYCIVPHVQDLKLPEIQDTVQRLTTANITITIISPYDKWENVVPKLQSECDYVASSSLHGLIVSDAMGIPTMWFQFPNKQTAQTEGNFKYIDYYDSIALPTDTTTTTLLKNNNLNSPRKPQPNLLQLLNQSIYNEPIPVDVRNRYMNQMIRSFPYHLFDRTCS